MPNPLSEKLASVPANPGVYIFKDSKERILYVGKAKNLKSRLNSYFQAGAKLDLRKTSMVRNVKDMSFITTANELEALVLEANLIKQYKPKFNIILRDDKNYPYLKVTIKDKWPAIEVVRKIKKDGSLYFGPYVPSDSMWEALSFIRRNFNIRPCKYKLDRIMRPCIQYQMGRCPGPCAGYISREDYMKAVDEAVRFLRGERKGLIDELQGGMQRLSEEMRFEEAASVRNRINALKRAWESQKVISPELADIDVIGHWMEGGTAAFQVFFIRNGVMIGATDFLLKNAAGMSAGGLYHSFIEMFYSKEIIPPEEIVIGVKPEGIGPLLAWLKKRREGKVVIVLPKRGKRRGLLKMANENAVLLWKGRGSGRDALEELKERLGMRQTPRSIGAFDVSTISGSESVGAFIYWEDGQFDKGMYRHLRIKTVSGMDDYAMMKETVSRVLKGIEPPDLILIDGGKGQLDAAKEAALYAGIKDITLIAVAKKPDRLITGAASPGDKGGTASLEDRKPSSLLLKRIRDEAHRFAISFHKKLRTKRLLSSSLENVKGIGLKRRLSLLRHFKSIEAIRKAEVEELLKAPGMNRKVAALLKEALNT